jgi:hypothetical protein
MATLAIELADAGLQAASCADSAPQTVTVADANGAVDWPGFAYYDGQRYAFGRAGEDQWFVHPRRVAHTFWARLAHEPSAIGPAGKQAPFSELAFHFLRDFTERLAGAGVPLEKLVLAVPGGYLKDAAAEEEKIGLLLGIAGELKLPLAGIIDMATAALCDPQGSGFNPAHPVLVLDLQLEGADLTLVSADAQLERKDFLHLPQSGYAQLLKHLTATMGNRFLRHTAFDILEDGRIEQMFFRQTKDFLLGTAAEHRFQINTATRGYEMVAKRDQIASDAAAFVNTLVQAVQTFVRSSRHASEPLTIALTDRAAHLPGLEARLRAAGFGRIIRLPAGAAARGAAHVGASQFSVQSDLADVPVLTAVPVALARRATPAAWEAKLQKFRAPGLRPAPTHVILDGIGHAIGGAGRFTIGVPSVGADLPLPDDFSAADDCAIPLVRENGRLWFIDAAHARESGAAPARTAVDSGDRLTIRCGAASTDVLFAHCNVTNGGRSHD